MKLNIRPLVKVVCSRFFGASTGFVDMLRQHVPSPKECAAQKVQHTYSGSLATSIAEDMASCNPDGTLMIQVTKLYAGSDGSTFRAFGRVLSGTIQNNSSVRVLGESYSLEDPEDSKPEKVSRLYIAEARYVVITVRAGENILSPNSPFLCLIILFFFQVQYRSQPRACRQLGSY